MGNGVRIALIVLFLGLVRAQPQQPNITEILKKVAETYGAASRYEFEVDNTTNKPGDGTPAMSHIRLAFKAPDKYRMEGVFPVKVRDANFGDGILVDDGSMVWFYFRKLNQYGSFSPSALAGDVLGDLGELRPEAVDRFLMWRYRGAATFSDGAKFLREEALEIAGAKVACYVLMVLPEKSGLPYTWWVTQTDHRIVREDHAGNSAVFTSIKLNVPISDERFKFEPPPGAQKLQMEQ